MGLRQTTSRWLASLGVETVSDELAREQYRLLAQQMPHLYFVVFLNSLFLAYASYPTTGVALAFGFPVAASLVMALRSSVWIRRAANYTGVEPIEYVRKALSSTTVSANILSLLLGLWAALVLRLLPVSNQVFVPVFGVLSIMTSSYCLMGYPRAAYSIMLSGSSMIIIATAATGEPKLIGLAINVSIVSLLVIYMIARQYRQLRTSVDARKELIEQRQQAQMLAEHDQLTGLPNRRALLNELQARQKSHPMESISMAMLDLDGFKPVNDTFGHAAGDDLLIAIAERLRNTIGEQGLIARLGGDEFAILFNRSADLGLAYDLIEAARMEIMKPLTINSYPVSLGVSVGLVIKDEMPDDPLQLLQHADIALYDAKATHKSAICIFEQSMDEKVKRATIIEQSLADEVLLEGIEIVFQPIFEMQTGNHIGFEALARWEHPLLGRIYPNEFIAAAERCGWVRPLTHLLFEKALETAKLWDDYAILSFNLSGSGIGSSGFEKTIPEMLAKFDFPPQRLALEITETALLRDKMGARHVLQSLQSLGIRIVLDDFGAGYASIGYLRNFRFDGIKLDGSLIREICHNANARDLLNGVLHLCKAIGVSVTAEMVETEAQLALLRPLPIDNIQGYLLGEPVAAGDTFEPDSAKRAYRQQVLTASK